MQTAVQAPAANPDEEKHRTLRKIATAQLINGALIILLSILWAGVYSYKGFLGMQCQDAIFVIINASLIVCCGHPPSTCRLKAHMILAILICFDELVVTLVFILYLVGLSASSGITVYGQKLVTPQRFILPIISVICSIVNIVLLIWSTTLSGQLGCCNNNRNDQPPQIIYVQQTAPAQQVAVQPGQMMVQPGQMMVQQPAQPMMVQQPAQPMMVQQPAQQGGYYVQPSATPGFAANQATNQPMQEKPQCPPSYAQINEHEDDAQKLLLSEQKQ